MDKAASTHQTKNLIAGIDVLKSLQASARRTINEIIATMAAKHPKTDKYNAVLLDQIEAA
jgi:hypothetical protein